MAPTRPEGGPSGDDDPAVEVDPSGDDDPAVEGEAPDDGLGVGATLGVEAEGGVEAGFGVVGEFDWTITRVGSLLAVNVRLLLD